MKDAHNGAAEHHESAAKSHRAAAESHGKNDHAKGKEHATQAQQHAQNANEHSKTANAKAPNRSKASSGKLAIALASRSVYSQFSNLLVNFRRSRPCYSFSRRKSLERSNAPRIALGGEKSVLVAAFLLFLTRADTA